MNSLLRAIHRLENALLYALVVVLVGLAVYQIASRNLIGTPLAVGEPLSWGDPLLRVVVLWLALVGAMIATREGGHISIDVAGHYLGPRAKIVAGVLTGLFSAGVCLVAAWYGASFVLEERNYADMAFAQVPAWICEAIIPFGLAVIGARFLTQAITLLLQRERAE